MNRTNQTIFGTISAIFAASIGCFMCGKNLIAAEQGGEHYWTHACATGDERMLIVGGDEAASINLATGATIKTVPMYVETVTCAQKDGTAWASSEERVVFPDGERTPSQQASTQDIVGARVDGALVRLAREKDSKGRPRGFSRVWVGAGPEVELTPDRFGVIGSTHAPMASAFFNRVGPVLPDGQLLLAAGWLPNRAGNNVEAAAWGTYAIDPLSGAVTPLAAPLTASAQLDTSLIWRLAASRDGKRVAAAFRGDGITRVAVFEGATLRWSADIEGAREPTALDFSPAGDRLAVATLSDDGAQGKVTWLDAEGAVVWKSDLIEGTVYFAQYLSDGSFVIMTSKRVVKRLGEDGNSTWP